MSDIYLQRYAWPHTTIEDYEPFDDIDYVVVIPAYDEPDLSNALRALNACHRPKGNVLVMVIINEPTDAASAITNANLKAYQDAIAIPTWFHLKAFHIKLPKKKAGVGLARKVGMDEAVRMFHFHGKEGIIICYDADCSCATNYFTAIEAYYSNPHNQLGLIYYEHHLHHQHPEQIIHYELFLRYYIDALRFSGYPHALQTLGSCITVRSGAYAKQGGMNTRKAGEDFYFIHKMVPIGGIGEINSTCIYPSDRVSGRVPFGTGHAIGNYLKQTDTPYEAYHPQIFLDLKTVFSSYLQIFDHGNLDQNIMPESCLSFYNKMSFHKDLTKILKQSNTPENFRKRFFSWWDGFRVLKFVHYTRDHFYPNIPLDQATNWLISTMPLSEGIKPNTPKEKLLLLREIDRKSTFYIK